MAQLVTVTLLLDVPDDGHAADWVNETLREMQRDFGSDSGLIDYAIGPITSHPATLANYQEGDAFTGD